MVARKICWNQEDRVIGVKMEETEIEEAAFRRAMGGFATGVAIITACDDKGNPVGITVNSLTSLSLNPPSLLWCLGKDALHRAALAEASSFAVHILGEGQDNLSNHFAHPKMQDWGDLSWSKDSWGLPVLEGALAVVACRTVQRIEQGDHLIIIGQAMGAKTAENDLPLLYWKGGYRKISS